ncbi:MAG: hypothetical protein MSS28_03580 [Tenericutes bacterium]|nr:hypothetical protein [Mycoplasmatota bacterium]
MKRSVKILKVLLVVIMAFTLSGCVKFNQTMEIKKDGTMNYNLIYAANKSLLQGQDNIFEEDDIKQLQEKGFTVTDYEDDKMKGVTISRNGILVDSISSDDKNAVYELTSVVSDDKKDNSKLFYVKKGFLKNTYVANFKFDSSSASDRSNINMRNEDGKEDDFTKDDMTSDDIFDTTDDGSDSTDNDSDMSALMDQYMKNMDLKFIVKLPYAAISNNATTKSSDNKELTWDLTKITKDDSIKFEFSLYNVTNIVILVAGVVLVVAVVFFIIKKKKGKGGNAPVVAADTSNVNNPVNNGVINPFPVQNNTVQAGAMQTNPGLGQNGVPVSAPVMPNGMQSVPTTPMDSVAVPGMMPITPEAAPVTPTMENVTPTETPVAPVETPVETPVVPSTPVVSTMTPEVASVNPEAVPATSTIEAATPVEAPVIPNAPVSAEVVPQAAEVPTIVQ